MRAGLDSRTVAIGVLGTLLTVALGILAGSMVGIAAGVITALVSLTGSAVVMLVGERYTRQAARAARERELLKMFAPPEPLDNREDEE